MDAVIQALCTAIAVLLDAADVALSGDHLEGALERVLQAEAILKMANDYGYTRGSIEEASLRLLNERIELVAARGMNAAELMVQERGANAEVLRLDLQVADAGVRAAQDLEDGFTSVQVRLDLEADCRASNDPSYTEDLT